MTKNDFELMIRIYSLVSLVTLRSIEDIFWWYNLMPPCPTHLEAWTVVPVLADKDIRFEIADTDTDTDKDIDCFNRRQIAATLIHWILITSGCDPNWVYAGVFQRGFYGTKVDSDGDWRVLRRLIIRVVTYLYLVILFF